MVAEAKVKKRLWTYSKMPQWDGQTRYELYDGELLEMPSPNLRHQDIVGSLYLLLMQYAREHDAGKVYLSPVDLYVSETRVFIPDLMFVTKERLGTERIEREDGQCLIAPPDLIVEIISPSTAHNDRVRKTKIYAEFGVAHYWIIEPEHKTLEALTLENGRYTLHGSFSEEDTFAPALFPGLQIPLATVFAA